MNEPLLRLRAPANSVQPTEGTPERVAFDRLRRGPAAVAELDELALAAGAVGLARWLTWSQRATDYGVVSTVLLATDGTTFAEFVAQRPGATPLARTLIPDVPHAPLVLSRFAMLHRRSEGAVLESPKSTLRVDLSPDAAAAVAGFGAARSADAAVAPLPSETAVVVCRLAAALVACGLLLAIGGAGAVAEDDDPVLSQWELHDLLLHERSRTRRTDRGRGATYRFAGVRPAPPALAAGFGSPAIAFETPDLGALHGSDAALAQLMEQRASRRDLGPMDAGRLGDFLHRTARVRAVVPGGDDAAAYDRLDRPHPSAGGMYELSTYVAVSQCVGLEPGIYRYDGVGHGLDRVAPAGPDLDRLLRDARDASLSAFTPPLVIILAADFTRLSWKYEGIAYASILKNVGVLYMSMQLVATAMGLGSCPLGGGDSELFSRAIGADWLHHTSVGEFLLGS